MWETGVRIRVLFIHAKVRDPKGLVLQQRTLANRNPIQASAGQAPVDTELAPDVRTSDPPQINLVVLEINQDFPVAHAGDFRGVVAVMGVMDFLPDLHPFVLEVRQRDVVDDRSLPRARAVDGVDDLDSLVRTRAARSWSDRDHRTAVIGTVLRLDLMDVAEVRRRLKPGREFELPFQDLPLVPVALHLG